MARGAVTLHLTFYISHLFTPQDVMQEQRKFQATAAKTAVPGHPPSTPLMKPPRPIGAFGKGNLNRVLNGTFQKNRKRSSPIMLKAKLTGSSSLQQAPGTLTQSQVTQQGTHRLIIKPGPGA